MRARQEQRQPPGLTCQPARREPAGPQLEPQVPAGLGQTGPEQAVQRHPGHPQLQGPAGHPGPARPTSQLAGPTSQLAGTQFPTQPPVLPPLQVPTSSPQLLPTWLHPQLELTQP
ncbi:hypothetical protein HMPREF1978_00452 [Actinomyces graevenitzii F0530]|uniref:Uncharacterized protein n=1 Tax=Actinomyces graevenitzii F0530 TaxID=1321817 RepID=U1RGJ0_9ACTO|nr:hypothetical protein HMPREF1978_00452 [Actinomyces graevenitzii F0530]